MTLMERLKSLSGGDDCLIRLALVEIESLRQQVALLREWIKQQGEVTNTCTFNILKEVCQDCACHRAKEQGK